MQHHIFCNTEIWKTRKGKESPIPRAGYEARLKLDGLLHSSKMVLDSGVHGLVLRQPQIGARTCAAENTIRRSSASVCVICVLWIASLLKFGIQGGSSKLPHTKAPSGHAN